MKKKLIAGFMAAVMVSTLLPGSGVNVSASSTEEEEEVMITPNEPMSDGVKWINSSIDGAIDETTDISEKDDFYTAINKDWLLSQTVNDDVSCVYNKMGSSLDKVTERLICIMTGKEDPEAVGNVEIPEEVLSHVDSLVQTFAAAAGDWDKRNSEGVSALKKYIQYIEDIDSVEELKEYFIDTDQQNLFTLELLPLTIDRSIKEVYYNDGNDTKTQYVTVTSETPLSVQWLNYGTSVYTGETGYVIAVDSAVYEKLETIVSAVMTGMGYSEEEAEATLKECLKFECKLVDHEADSAYYSQSWKGTDPVTCADVEAMEGDYPLGEMLDAYGYDSDEIIVVNPDYVKYIGSVIKDSNLDMIKAWLIVNTVLDATDLLDWDTHELAIGKKDEDSESNTTNDSGDTTEEGLKGSDNELQLQIQAVQEYLSDCLDMVYVSRYCTTEEKEDITELINEIIEQYHGMIQEEDWMSEGTKEEAIAKLDNLGINVLYPETFDSYDYLDFGDDTDLLDLVADINQESRGSNADQIGQPTSNTEFPPMSTTEVNACYSPNDNSINILAGYIAGDTYDIDMDKEEKLALLGVVIGHEISHGFDDGGAQWDKDGKFVDWWDFTDKMAFEKKVQNLQTYYSSLTPYPGGDKLIGSNFSKEAIADMAGVKVILRIAAEDPDFDYKLFFETYASLFAAKETLEIDENRVQSDEHPLACLRCNVTLSQFDEFLDTFGIQKGDGMYTDAKDRILVW